MCWSIDKEKVLQALSGETVIVGKKSRLSLEIQGQLTFLGIEPHVIGLRELSDAAKKSEKSILELFPSAGSSLKLIWASGLIDPSSPRVDLDFLNFQLPVQVISLLRSQAREVKFVSIGSVLEPLSDSTNYIASKRLFSDWLEKEMNSESFLHIRTHTLVNMDPPPAHMFLGQLTRAISTGGEFRMSEGYQYRQYIEFRSLANFVVELIIENKLSKQNFITYAGSQPVQLRSLAIRLVEKYNKNLRLVFDPKLNPINEIYNPYSTTENLFPGLENSFDLVDRLIPYWLGR